MSLLDASLNIFKQNMVSLILSPTDYQYIENTNC